MRTPLAILALVALLASTGVADEKYVHVDQNLELPSFVGWVDNEIIVVLRQDVAVNHARDLASDRALSNYRGFEALAQRFQVTRSTPQFVGADRKVGGQALARHYRVRVAKGTVEQARAAYESHPLVQRVERIGLHTMFATPNDTYYDNPPPSFAYDQWHYWDTKGVDADLAWDNTAGDPSVLVGILDSGTRYFHVDLGGDSPVWGPDNPFAGGNVFVNPGEIPGDGLDNDGNGYVDDTIGYDFIQSTGGAGVSCIDQDCGTKDNDPDDGDGHGTHVGGTVGAITNNGRSVAGVAGGFSDGTTSGVGNGVKIVPCRMGYHARYRGITTGIVDMAAAAEAMYYMADLVDAGHNVAAINCSWGNSNSGGLGAAADFLLSRDVVIVVAAGNSNSSSSSYLGSRGDCLDVAATDRNGNGASFTNYGSWVDVAAPGVDIMSTYANPDDPDLNNHYVALLGGTSMSAPHVAGIIALLESCNSSLSGPQKFNLVVNNTTPYNDSRDLGSGIANAFAALNAASCAQCTETTPVADFSGSPTSGDAPLTVNFTDLSTNNPSSWFWDFGDGGTSTAQSPSYTYNSAGAYSVTLTASNCAGSDVVTKTNYITVNDPPCTETTPVADFSGSPTGGDAPLNVSFTDLSANNPDTWSWDFGDGGTSTAQNPSYTYNAAGTYTVSLTASNCAGSDTNTKTDYVTVTEPVGTAVHVSAIDLSIRTRGPWTSADGYVTIVDASGNPVANATVSADWSGSTSSSQSALTAADGRALFESGRLRNASTYCWTLTVTDVTGSGLTYDAAANVETSDQVGNDCNAARVSTVHRVTSLSNHPNPFSSETEILFRMPVAGEARLEVFNMLGQSVRLLTDGRSAPGVRSFLWDGRDQQGRRVSSGTYFYRLTVNGETQVKQMTLLR